MTSFSPNLLSMGAFLWLFIVLLKVQEIEVVSRCLKINQKFEFFNFGIFQQNIGGTTWVRHYGWDIFYKTFWMIHFEWDISNFDWVLNRTFWVRHFEWDILCETLYVRHFLWDKMSGIFWRRQAEWDILSEVFWLRHFEWDI